MAYIYGFRKDPFPSQLIPCIGYDVSDKRNSMLEKSFLMNEQLQQRQNNDNNNNVI